jgi:Na+-driven multidrug efflux pump
VSAVDAAPEPGLTRHALRMTGGLVAMTTAGTLLQVVVIAFLGHLGGDALYVRSVYLPFGFLALALTEGLVIGVQVSTARARRAGRPEEAGGVLTVAAGAGVAGLLVLAGLTAACAGPLGDLLAVPPAERTGVWTFVVATLAAGAVALLPTLVSAALRGCGRTRTAGRLAIAESALIFGAVVAVQALWSLGPLSVPAGFVAGSLPALAAAVVLAERAGIRPAVPARLAAAVRPLWTVAVPVAGSFLVLAVSSSGYLHLIGAAGPAAVAGLGLGQSVQTFLIVPATAIGSAAALALALHGGPGDDPLRLLLRLAVPAYLALGAAVFVVREPLVALFARDERVRAVAVDYLGVVGPSLALLGVTLAVLTYLEQSGHAPAALLLNVTFFAAVLAIGALLGGGGTLAPHTLIVLIAVANVPGCCCVLAAARTLLRRPDGRPA